MQPFSKDVTGGLHDQSNEALAEMLYGLNHMQDETARSMQAVKAEMSRRVDLGEMDSSFTHRAVKYSLRVNTRWVYSDQHKAEKSKITRELDEFQQQEGLAIQKKTSAWYVTQAKKQSDESPDYPDANTDPAAA